MMMRHLIYGGNRVSTDRIVRMGKKITSGSTEQTWSLFRDIFDRGIEEAAKI